MVNIWLIMVNIWLMTVNNNLVGGFNHLETKMKVSWDDSSQYMGK
jgi:hypothetical protein